MVKNLAALLTGETTEATLPLHTSALAALCQAAFAASAKTCQEVIDALSWSRMQTLLRSSHVELSAEAWHTLRNLCHTTDQDKNQDRVLAWAGPEVVSDMPVAVITGAFVVL